MRTHRNRTKDKTKKKMDGMCRRRRSRYKLGTGGKVLEIVENSAEQLRKLKPTQDWRIGERRRRSSTDNSEYMSELAFTHKAFFST